jgi:putative DNA primase/helicase
MNVALERPETQAFAFNPLHEVFKDRGKYIAAALIIACAYQACSDKVTVSAFSGFEEWSRIVREPLIRLGMEDPVLSQEKAYQEDPGRTAALRLLELWKEKFGTDSRKAKDIIDAALEQRRTGDANAEWVNPDLNELLIEQCGERGRINNLRFAQWLRSIHNRVFVLDDDASYRITVATENKKKGHRWKIQKLGATDGHVAAPVSVPGEEEPF